MSEKTESGATLNDRHRFYHELSLKTDSKILFLIADGLGGLPGPEGKTELEAANTPNLDKLAAASETGRALPVRPGVTPGSGPAHFGLFGYDPLECEIGRGALSAYGVGSRFEQGDVALRVNFCTIADGKVVDRRAGRIADEKNVELTERLNKIEIPGVELNMKTEKEYRSVLVLSGEGLDPRVADTDPQKTDLAPHDVVALDPAAEKTAGALNAFLAEAKKVLSDQDRANYLLFRGAAGKPNIPTISDIWRVRTKGIAAYPMYKGIARLLGMDVNIDVISVDEELAELEKSWSDHDYFFFHFKKTDSAGEDGDFARKVEQIELFDSILPRVLALNPNALVITGDHSTPSVMKGHSWHPSPFILAGDNVLPDENKTFGERACMRGAHPQIYSADLMPLAMAAAGKLNKYGA